MTEYVAGFMFSEDKRKVALIIKKRPRWQKGRKNAIGGHVEPGETPSQAMVREFEEETGVRHTDWRLFCTLKGEGFEVHFYWTTGVLSRLKTMTDEEICICKATFLHGTNVLPNLRWLIPMALDKDGLVSIVYETGGRPVCADCGCPQPDVGSLHMEECPGHNPDYCVVCEEESPG